MNTKNLISHSTIDLVMVIAILLGVLVSFTHFTLGDTFLGKRSTARAYDVSTMHSAQSGRNS